MMHSQPGNHDYERKKAGTGDLHPRRGVSTNLAEVTESVTDLALTLGRLPTRRETLTYLGYPLSFVAWRKLLRGLREVLGAPATDDALTTAWPAWQAAQAVSSRWPAECFSP